MRVSALVFALSSKRNVTARRIFSITNKQEMNKIENNTEKDDGSLSFLKIPEQDGNKQFHGKEISQSELVNTSFMSQKSEKFIDYLITLTAYCIMR